MYLADTTFIIDLTQNDLSAVNKAMEIDKSQQHVFISSITVQEYLRGIYYLFMTNKSKLKTKLGQSESDLSRFSVIDLNYVIAKKAASIDAELTLNGTQIGYADVLIGSTAVSYDLTLLTRNIKHFKVIPSLVIEDY
jgi:tRNA(fMet)-specific endonuclease VapC